ncbi:conserved hypothetical protein [Hyella patelloides LEGE 07179]|uniref:Uncharacterized protein n=2 Tax=Hyella TaxID=945733 RepID=A0A563VSP9_9CYAN|nr:conserved hypothetical protein [Hyella patelloides LEGE 07179]
MVAVVESEVMETINVRSRSDANGILHLDVPVNLKDAEFTITIKAVEPAPIGKGYPPGFFDQTYGSCQDDPIEVDSEGIYEDLDELL